jgi:hypothetical protein
MSKNEPAKSVKLTSEEASRLWQHGIHEENILNSRLNFFLVLESILLGVVAMLFGQNPPATNQNFILRAFLFLGLALTIVWAYIAARQKYVFDSLRKRVRETLPEYAETIKIREQVRWPFSNLSLLSYVVPAIFILIWIALQFAV